LYVPLRAGDFWPPDTPVASHFRFYSKELLFHTGTCVHSTGEKKLHSNRVSKKEVEEEGEKKV
jgi:hypothetical protein